ncbi:hypothetical protein SBA5_440016 [Candidatus Sulfotelmatomonas gaucii]|uniref:Uncharacterized protein n=1 Tax=Candidatus Sulfuritelmatomonas gaucii TaxID=2043161 RepID=A0A2N9LLW8_9BACT|nr:hypothetical protein SBA5_440016 [Candidatus Sulfotelmatomonas gaucii]
MSVASHRAAHQREQLYRLTQLKHLRLLRARFLEELIEVGSGAPIVPPCVLLAPWLAVFP